MSKFLIIGALIVLMTPPQAKTKNQELWEAAREREVNYQIRAAEARIEAIDNELKQKPKARSRGGRPSMGRPRVANPKPDSEKKLDLNREKKELKLQIRKLKHGKIEVEPVIRLGDVHDEDVGKIIKERKGDFFKIKEIKDADRIVVEVWAQEYEGRVVNGKVYPTPLTPKVYMHFGVEGIGTARLSEGDRIELDQTLVVRGFVNYSYYPPGKDMRKISMPRLVVFEKDWDDEPSDK